MLLSAILIPAFKSAHRIGHAVGGRIGISAVRDARVWLTQVEAPGSPLHGAMMRYIRSAARAWGWFRFAQTHIGRAGPRTVPLTLIQDGRRKHA